MNLKPIYEEFKTTLLIFAVISWVIFIIVPMPGIIISLCMSLSLAFSLVILMTSASIDSWDKIRTFPMIMLMSTIFRIAFNIATTRKIITGEDPGAVIEAAGHLIVRDNITIGFVMFIILIIVQFVIANGANRFGEVSARFMLDALPGKQISIDNELNQGAIDDKTAKKQKKRLQMQVDFYGSLDGAGKYIKGDVWISVTMILVNLIVGLIVGMVQLDLSFMESANRFTILTIGDGLVNLISAIMITVAGALIMAKVEDEDEVNNQEKSKNIIERILLELVPNPRILYVAGGSLILLGIVGLPFFELAIPGVALIFAGFTIQKNQKVTEKNKADVELKKRTTEQKANKEVKIRRSVEPIVLEVGYKLAPYFMTEAKDILGNKKENIHDKTDLMRQIFANKLGIKIPMIKIRDNVTLASNTYVIKIKESAVATGVIKKDKVLAIPTALVIGEIDGEKTKDPIYGQEAYWITENQLDEAADKGYDVWNPITIIATHLHEIVEKNIYQFISLQQVADMVQEVGEEHPILKEKMDKIDDLYLLQKVIVSLLKEKVSIKDLPTIIESFIESYNLTKDIDTMVSLVRQRISRQICENYINKDGKIYLISVKEEDSIVVNSHNGVNILSMPYDWQTKFLEKLKKEKEENRAFKIDPILVVNRPELRPAFSRMMESFSADTPVISVYELPTTVKNKVIANI